MHKIENTRWAWLLLFTSAGTLLCCALPIMLVSIGLGAVVAGMALHLPLLITLSLYKEWVFAASALLLVLSAWLLYGPIYRPGRSCPADPALAAVCARAGRWNRRIYWLSVGIWCVGFFFAYLAQYVFY